MRKLLLPALVAFFFISCNSTGGQKDEVKPAISRPDDSLSLLCQYWILQDADHPEGKDILEQEDDGTTFQPGIVFMTDSAVLENPAGERRYGRFNQSHSPITVNFDDGGVALYAIIKLDSQNLWLERKENNTATTLKYKATDSWWPDSKTNPFSKENYAWTYAPDKPETDAQIKDRVIADVRFYAYYFQGHINGEASTINSIGIPNCFNWYSGGFTVQSPAKVDPKWVKCFYNREQALKAREILTGAIRKKYHWDQEESNFVKQTAPVLRQMVDSLSQ